MNTAGSWPGAGKVKVIRKHLVPDSKEVLKDGCGYVKRTKKH